MDSPTVLPLVVYATTAVYIASGLLSMLTAPNGYDQVGQGGLVGGKEERSAGVDPRARAQRLIAEQAEREDDARQMLQARNERRARRGEPTLDVEVELARLQWLDDGLLQSPDAEVIDEIRQLMLLRNERRTAQGLEALDVDAGIAHTLGELAIGARATIPAAPLQG